MLFFAATLHKDNILILLAPLVGISSISSSCIHDMGPHQLNDPATVLLRLHLPYDLLKLLGVQTETDTMLHYFTCNCKHKQINSKHLTSTSLVGFWQLRSEICSEDRTAWGNTLMPRCQMTTTAPCAVHQVQLPDHSSSCALRLWTIYHHLLYPENSRQQSQASPVCSLCSKEPISTCQQYFKSIQYFTLQGWLPQWS